MKSKSIRPSFRSKTFPCSITLTLLAAVPTAHAVNRDWSGVGGNWATAATWTTTLSNDGTDNLRFRGTNVTNNNDFAAATAFNNISFINTGTGGAGNATTANSAFNLTGNSITLSNTGNTINTFASTAVITDTISLNVALSGGSATLATNANHNLIIAGVLSGSAPSTVTKSGVANLTLSNANTYTGKTVVTGGTLILSNTLALQNSALDTTGAGLVNLSGITTLTLGGLTGATGDLASVITTGYSGLTALTLNNGANQSYSGVIADGAAGMTLTKTGAGTQTLTGASANTYSGLTTVSSGGLTLTKTGVNAIAGNVLVNGTGTLTLGAADQIINTSNVEVAAGTFAVAGFTETVNGVKLTGGAITGTAASILTSATAFDFQSGSSTAVLAGTAGATKTTGGTVSLSRGSTYSGGTTLTGGTLQIGVGSAGSVGAITSSAIGTGGLALNGGTLSSNSGTNRTLLNAITIGGNVTLGDATNTGIVTFSADADLTSGTRTLTTATGSGATFNGIVSNGDIIKEGAGTLALNANSSTVAVTVNSGTLAGTGTVGATSIISGNLSIGALAGGVGAMNYTSLSLGSASTFIYQMTGGGIAADLGDIAGALTINTSAILDLVELGTYTAGNKFTLFAYDGALTGNFSGLLDGANFTDDLANSWVIDYNDSTAGLNGGVSASNTYVTITAIPEPNAAALLGGLGVLALLRRRRS